MVCQVFKFQDNESMDYFSKKYNLKNTPNSNYAIEIRNISENFFEDTKNFLSKLNLFTSHFSINGTFFDLLLYCDSLIFLKSILLHNKNQSTEQLISCLVQSIENYYLSTCQEYVIGNKVFNFREPYLMGILNVTPDSFSDGGKFYNRSSAVKRAFEMIEEGADIIDIGGESTRPGSDPVTAEEEIERIIPVIEEIMIRDPSVIISVDSYKSQVAKAALEHGAKIINDISGFTFDPEIADVCKEHNATAILMHIRGKPKTMQQNPQYEEIITDIYSFLSTQIQYAKSKGIKNIILDPGIGFGKSAEDNFTILKRLNDFRSLGYPILIGLSRKSFIGKTLNLEIGERDLPSAVLESISILNSARIIRTHNVRNGKQIIKLLSKLI